jgi:hypothetical protein
VDRGARGHDGVGAKGLNSTVKPFLLFLLVAAAAAWQPVCAAGAVEGPSRAQAVSGLLCPFSIFASLEDVGRLCALEDDFQRTLSRTVTTIESAILLTAPEKAAELRANRTQLRLYLEREAADGALCRDQRGNDAFRWYKQMRSQGADFLARVAEGAATYKPTFAPLGCL